MAIAETHYNELKEYWDFQRKREYNYEQLCNVCDNIGSNFRFTNGKNGEELKNDLWNKIQPDEYEEPPKDWVPQDEKYRLWNEGTPKKFKVSFKKMKTVQA